MFGLDVRLVISKFEEVVLIVMFLKEFVEFFGIFVKIFNEVGFYILIIRFLFIGIF